MITVILLAGLPASGKSTLAQKLRDRFVESNHQLTHIEYDSIESSIQCSMEEGEEKEKEEFETKKGDSGDQQRFAWNKAREKAIQKMEEEIQRKVREKKKFVVLMDDNFHLRGMRKKIHRVLLKYRPRIRFGILHLKIPIDVCLERNRNRTGRGRVPDDVISKMNACFESPRTAWEANSTMEINVTNTIQVKIENIVDFINSCPIIVDTTDSDEILGKQAVDDRKKTLECQHHQIDKLLRVFVSRVAKFNKEYVGLANAGRRKLLEQIKTGIFIINIEEGNDQLLDPFLELVVPADEIMNDSSTKRMEENNENDVKTKNLEIRSMIKNALRESPL